MSDVAAHRRAESLPVAATTTYTPPADAPVDQTSKRGAAEAAKPISKEE